MGGSNSKIDEYFNVVQKTDREYPTAVFLYKCRSCGNEFSNQNKDGVILIKDVFEIHLQKEHVPCSKIQELKNRVMKRWKKQTRYINNGRIICMKCGRFDISSGYISEHMNDYCDNDDDLFNLLIEAIDRRGITSFRLGCSGKIDKYALRELLKLLNEEQRPPEIPSSANQEEKTS